MILEEDYEIVNPGCGCASFAVPAEIRKRWLRTHEDWHCPHCGKCRYFTGASKEQQRIRELERRVAREQNRVIQERSRANDHARRYKRMRARIQNGVCPCCNRTFTNLARHMATKHPQIPKPEQTRHLRHLYGMTQADLARETGVGMGSVSSYETGRGVGEDTRNRIERWVEDQLVRES